jgi:hypothetical protein
MGITCHFLLKYGDGASERRYVSKHRELDCRNFRCPKSTIYFFNREGIYNAVISAKEREETRQ